MTALLLLIASVLAAVLAWRNTRAVRRADRAGAGTEWRRCEDCRRRWLASPADNLGRWRLLRRRRVRRAARAAGRPSPSAKGWSRCPSCLSTAVRTSRQQDGANPQPAAAPQNHRGRRLVLSLVGLVVVVTGVQLAVVAASALHGRQALLRAVEAGKERDFDRAGDELRSARGDFGRSRAQLHSPNPLILAARYLPLARMQWRAVDAMNEGGLVASRTGLVLTDPVQRFLAKDADVSIPAITAQVSELQPDVALAVGRLEEVDRRLTALADVRLLPPLGSVRTKAAAQLTDALGTAQRTRDVMTVTSALLGGKPTRILILSQNPDEPRPTGGYIGTYGLMTSGPDGPELVEYAGMRDWREAHPDAVVPVDQAPYPLRQSVPPAAQSLSNVGVTPSWPASARLASQLWEKGGEDPVDAVLTFLPDTIVRLVGVLGEVHVPGYPDRITKDNLDSRLEFYVHREEVRGQVDSQRKAFISALGREVLDRSLALPRERSADLAQALAASFDAGDAALWAPDQPVATALRSLAWDGELRAAAGDYYADAEYALASKNGRDLLRTFTHTATLEPDGSGLSTTVMSMRNKGSFEPSYNDGAPIYFTPYGPQGGALVAPSDTPLNAEPTLLGHPSAGWGLRVFPGESRTLTTAWRAPGLAADNGDGTWDYRLTFLPTRGHRGDVLRLDVLLPDGWTWLSDPPPTSVALDKPFIGSWRIRTSPNG